MSDVEDLVEVTPIEQLSVDESADQIREIIGLLEDGEVTMGEAKGLRERGDRLLEHVERGLEVAEGAISRADEG
jgi:exonuclease VII small subunit